jgi:hypothetical protein
VNQICQGGKENQLAIAVDFEDKSRGQVQPIFAIEMALDISVLLLLR